MTFRAELQQMVEREGYGTFPKPGTASVEACANRRTRPCPPKLNPAIGLLRQKLKQQRFSYREDIIERDGKLVHVFTGPVAAAPVAKAARDPDYADPKRNSAMYKRMMKESAGVKGSYRRTCWAMFEAHMRLGNYGTNRAGELRHVPLKGQLFI